MLRGKKSTKITSVLMASAAASAIAAPHGFALASGSTLTISTATDENVEVLSSQRTITVTGTGSISVDDSDGAIYRETEGEIADFTITNDGSILNLNGEGIELFGEDAVTRNTIVNSGTITSEDDTGVFVYSEYGEITLNTVENHGLITSYEAGVGLDTDATFDGIIANNSLVNAGTIVAEADGVLIESDGDFTGNNITNSGLIRADEDGIDVDLDEGSGSVTGNTITNSGTIISEDDTIEITSGYFVNGNTIENTGSLTSETGDVLNIDGDDGITGNRITNSGRVTSESEDGFDIGSVYGGIAANEITNAAGAIITAAESAISITATGDINSNAVRNHGNLVVTGDFDELAQDETLDDASGIALFIDDGEDGEIFNNALENTGSIDAGVMGIAVITADGDVYSNDIANSGDITAGFDGISLLATRADVDDNNITNTGTIASAIDGISLVSGFGGLGFSTAFLFSGFAPEAADQFASVSDNDIINSGTITLGLEGETRQPSALIDDFGEDGSPTAIDLSAFATRFDGPTSASIAEITRADIEGNDVVNSGVLNGISGGISMTSLALQISETSDSQSGSTSETSNASSVVDVYADVDFNSITNTGSIVSDGAGIALTAFASSTAEATSSADADATSESTASASASASATADADAFATIEENTITNSGAVFAAGLGEDDNFSSYIADGTALSIFAWAYSNAAADADSSADASADTDNSSDSEFATAVASATATGSSNAYADIIDNTVINTGALIGAESGIILTATSDADLTVSADARGSERVDSGTPSQTAALTENPTSNRAQHIEISNNTIINSGAIVGLEGAAIAIGAFNGEDDNTTIGDNSLALSAPAFLGGSVYLPSIGDGEDNDVTITTGPSHSVLWNIEGDLTEVGEDALPFEVVADQVPYWIVSNGEDHTFATFDPTVVMSSTQQFGEMQSLVGAATSGAATASDTAGSAGFVVARGAEADFDGNGVNTLGYGTEQTTLLAGLNLSNGNGVSGQAYFGQVESTATAVASIGWDAGEPARSFTRDANGTVAGGSVRIAAGSALFDFGLTTGSTDVEISRLVNANLVDNGTDGDTRTDGLGWANGETKADWIAPSLGVSGTYAWGEGLTITPSAKASFMSVTMDAYSETTMSIDTSDNAISVASIGEQTFAVFEAEIGVSLTQVVNEGLSVSYGGGFINRTVDADAVEVTMFDGNGNLMAEATQSISVQSEDIFVPYLTGGVTFSSDNLVLEVSGRAQSTQGNLTGSVGAQLSINF